MQVYRDSTKNYVIIAKIDKKEVYKIDFTTCAEPRETLNNFYTRQNTKPTLLVNGGFFNMFTGAPVFNFVDDGVSKSSDAKYQWGIGVTSDTDLEYSCKSNKIWKDFISGYPNLIDGGKKLKIDFAKELDYKARRTALGYNKDYIYIVCVENPGMNFSELQDVLLGLKCEFAINLDGGGSTNMLYNGKKMTTDSYDRAVDNVLAIYAVEKENTTANDTNKTNMTTSNSTITIKYNPNFLVPDSTETINVAGKTLTINKKICPDNLVSDRYIASYIKSGDHMKPCRKVDNGSGKPRGITIHNTEAIKVSAKTTMAEQYTRSFYNGNGGGGIVHYFVDDTSIWQLLNTEPGKTEQGWHAKDGTSRTKPHSGAKYSDIGGNLDTIAVECIGNSALAEDNAARLIAYLIKQHNLDPDIDLYTHNYFLKMPEQIVPGAYKNCPVYILPHLSTFKNTVKKYYNSLSGNITSSGTTNNTTTAPTTTTYYKVMVDGYFSSYQEAYQYKTIIDKKFYMNSLIINDSGKYYIRCATYKTNTNASALVNRMCNSGYPATVISC